MNIEEIKNELNVIIDFIIGCNNKSTELKVVRSCLSHLCASIHEDEKQKAEDLKPASCAGSGDIALLNSYYKNRMDGMRLDIDSLNARIAACEKPLNCNHVWSYSPISEYDGARCFSCGIFKK